MRKLKVIDTDRGIMYANDDGSICKEFSNYSVIHSNFDFFVVDRKGKKVDSTQDKARGLFYIAEQANKAVDLVKSGVQLDLALNKLDTEGLSGAINFAVDCEELEHIPEINEHLNRLPNKLIARVNEPLKAKEKQIAGVEANRGIHLEKTVENAIDIVSQMKDELNTFNTKVEVYSAIGVEKKRVERAYKIVEKVIKVRESWISLQETMPDDKMISKIAVETDVHPTNVEDWICEFKISNSRYLIEI